MSIPSWLLLCRVPGRSGGLLGHPVCSHVPLHPSRQRLLSHGHGHCLSPILNRRILWGNHHYPTLSILLHPRQPTTRDPLDYNRPCTRYFYLLILTFPCVGDGSYSLCTLNGKPLAPDSRRECDKRLTRKRQARTLRIKWNNRLSGHRQATTRTRANRPAPSVRGYETERQFSEVTEPWSFKRLLLRNRSRSSRGG